MRILVDTNILTRIVEPGHIQHAPALQATDLLGKQGHDLYLVPQVIYEFWVVSTRPLQVNGLGRTPAQAATDLIAFKMLFTILEDTPLILPAWEKLVTAQAISGKDAHDARLVAAMGIHGVSGLLTFNKQDFQRFSAISLITPDTVIASPSTP